MKKICGFCNYYRPYCSNSKSENFQKNVQSTDGCEVYVRRGQKAPLTMRLANRALATAVGVARRDAGKE